MNKTIIYSLIVFLIPCISITAQQQVPVYIESSQLIYMDELDSYLYQAAINFINFKDKEASQKLAGLNFEQLVDDKLEFKNTLEKEWNKQAVANNVWNQSAFPNTDNESAYFKVVDGKKVKK